MTTSRKPLESIKHSDPAKRKIYELPELAPLIAELKANGKRIIHCHGVFDLLHIGHMRHFAEAKTLGDILVVSLTEDRYVNKGPHRPAFPEHLRAEAIAALAGVDFVTISRSANAGEMIAGLRPDVYVKGPDYKNHHEDITGGIDLEEQAVRAHGGIVHYTDGETYSSSALLNRHVPTFAPATETYLEGFRQAYSFSDIMHYIDRLSELEVVVTGEAILDEYIYCEQMGKSAKDPVLAMRYHSRELFAGGSLAVANHLANFVKRVTLLTFLGEHEPQEAFIRSKLAPNVTPVFFEKADSPTIVKRRYVEHYLRSKHFEVYHINDEPLTSQEETTLCALFDEYLPQADMVVAADFGHGLLTTNAIAHLTQNSRFLAVNTQINAANIRYHAISAYDRADYICINEQEVRLDARNRHAELSELVQQLSARLVCERLLVTRGSSGVTYFERATEHSSPAFATTVVERTGSGDAVLAITSAAVAVGAPGPIVAFLANVIGAQKVQIIGNRSAVDRIATLKFIASLLK